MASASTVVEQLSELRAWNFVAVVVWHAVACLTLVLAEPRPAHECRASYRETAPQVFALNALVGDASTLEARALVACTAWAKFSLRALAAGFWTRAGFFRRQRAPAARTGAHAALGCCTASARRAARAS